MAVQILILKHKSSLPQRITICMSACCNLNSKLNFRCYSRCSHLQKIIVKILIYSKNEEEVGEKEVFMTDILILHYIVKRLFKIAQRYLH